MRFIQISSILAAATLAFSFAMVTDADAAKKKKPAACVGTTAEGQAITEDIARANALITLDDLAIASGRKRSGKVKTTCTKSMGGVMNVCRSTQNICK